MSEWIRPSEEFIALEEQVDELTDLYNHTESSRVHHAQRGDTYKLLLINALEMLGKFSMKTHMNEVIEFDKEVNEWFEDMEYKEENEK